MRLLKTASLVFALTLPLLPVKMLSAPSDPIQSVPADAAALISIDVKKLIKLPVVEEMKNSNQQFKTVLLEVEGKLKTQGIVLDDFADKLCIFASDEKNYGAVFSTGVKEQQMEGLFNEVMKTNKSALINTQLISGKKVFVLNDKKANQFSSSDMTSAMMAGALSGKEITALTYLKDDVILFSSQEQIAALYKKIKESNITSNKDFISKRSNIDKNAVAWMIFETPQKTEAKKAQPNSNPMMQSYEDKIKGGDIALIFSGKENKDIGLDINLECEDAQTSNLLAFQVNTMMTLMIPQNTPQLASEITKAVKVQSNDKNLTGKIFVNEELQAKLKDFYNQQKQDSQTRQLNMPQKNSSGNSFDPAGSGSLKK